MTLSIVGATHFVALMPPAIQLNVTSTTGAPNAVVEGAALVLIRIHADGSRHKVLTGAAPRISGGAWVGIDYHCPFNQSVSYEVNAGPVVASPPVTLPSSFTWLVHASSPQLSVSPLKVAVIGDRTRPSRATEFQPLDSLPIFVSDQKRGSIQGSIDLRVPDAYAMDTLMDDDSVILINSPGTAGWDITWMWVQPKDVQYVNPAGGLVSYPMRHVVIPFKQSIDPDTDSAALTCGKAATFAATCGSYAALYGSCAHAATDTRP